MSGIIKLIDSITYLPKPNRSAASGYRLQATAKTGKGSETKSKTSPIEFLKMFWISLKPEACGLKARPGEVNPSSLTKPISLEYPSMTRHSPGRR